MGLFHLMNVCLVYNGLLSKDSLTVPLCFYMTFRTIDTPTCVSTYTLFITLMLLAPGSIYLFIIGKGADSKAD